MKNSNVVWALVAGLAVGYIVGNKLPMSGGGGGSSPSARTAESGSTEIPKDWITEKEIGAEASFAGLTAAQRFNALKVLNSKPCDCGCPHGTIAKCKKEDPACPVAPSEIALAAARSEGRQDATKRSSRRRRSRISRRRRAGASRRRPQKVLLASWTPVKGPKYAKVTILEFSDFQ